ncbi:hypothetical protein [Streptomyces sp. NRRL S-350]|uniref:hypothetical protein n=1 Tax=Streptomyces sp. NRRL S-350 TaxID=1463902 RepID=UPI000AB4ABF0|nr:hypothetical protein [Streptomyces sp. NRRL S-350]
MNGLAALAAESSAPRGDVLDKKLCPVGVAQARLGGGQGTAAVSATRAPRPNGRP